MTRAVNVRVRLFGQLAELAGRREIDVTFDEPRPTCAALRRRLADAAPQLAGRLPACRFAVNHAFAAEAQSIADGDEVALIGLVSGG